jgi:hypothetical protein
MSNLSPDEQASADRIVSAIVTDDRIGAAVVAALVGPAFAVWTIGCAALGYWSAAGWFGAGTAFALALWLFGRRALR